ncbi:MAG: transposase [Desulfobacterales bacterium]|nr:transposase [Desulfobacterales bacterium]
MARQWRIQYPGALYHVLSRGNDHQDIFLSEKDKQLFLEIIGELTERFSVEAYAFVLMNNHYHLLLKTVRPNLSKAMQWLGTAYTRRFNLQNNKSGHLFQGRFKSILIENDAYLLRLSCYIHRNPLRAGMIKRLADYPWSSYRYYAYKKKPPAWLATGLILSQLHAADKRRAYRMKVQQYSNEKNSIWEDIKHGLIYGSQDFVDQIRSRYLSDSQQAELPQHNRMLGDIQPEVIVQRSSVILNCDLETMKQSRRVSETDKNNRDMMIYHLWENGGITNEQIGQLFGLTYSSISRRVRDFSERCKKDKGLKKNYGWLKSQIKV